MKEPVDHIRRPPLPWREEVQTECGRNLADVAQHISIDDAVSRFKDQGKTRATMTICVTCIQTAQRWAYHGGGPVETPGSWQADPTQLLVRYLEGAQWDESRHKAMNAELHAIAAVVAAHRDEYDLFLSSLAATVPLSDLRATRAVRRAITPIPRRF